MKDWTTSHYTRPRNGGYGYALKDPYRLGHRLPDFALWLVQQACGDGQRSDAGTHLFFNVTEGAVTLEVKAPSQLYDQFRGDPAYYERLD